MRLSLSSHATLPLVLLSALPVGVLGGDVLSTNGYTTCMNNPSIKVDSMAVQYNRAAGLVVFDVAGSSAEVQNVTASIVVTAYGQKVYQNDLNPCDSENYVERLCPVPAGNFSAVGTQNISAEYAGKVPSIAWSIPDLDGQAQVELKNANGEQLACIQSTLGNGKSLDVPTVKYVAGGVAAAAFVLSGLTAVASSGHPGASTSSPTFSEVIGWFQGLALNGMLSVSYPSVYQSFSKNFAFSTGLIPWSSMQIAIDSFRNSTGGNLTENSYEYLRNVTVVATANGNSTGSSIFKRSLADMILIARGITTEVNGTTSVINSTAAGGNTTSNGTLSADSKPMHYVKGIQAYVEQLMIPQADTFMTVLLIFAIIVATITVLILLAKVILEAVALGSTLPKSLESWRKRYWLRLAKTITNLVLLLYGTWTLYCVYQFTDGDSWAAKALAGVTWALFTSLLAFFTFKIVSKVRQAKKIDGDASALYENKDVWLKYSLFYDNFKKGYWWLFIPAIFYMFARNAVIAAANGHGMVQAIGQMAVEVLFLGLLVWNRPYSLKSGNIINIVIQVVRVLSVVCILVFVEELGISQTTKTITGVILIVVQSVLTGVLAILIAVNAIITCVRENPHRRRRKDAEKMHRDLDNLTPLDARNSLLMDRVTDYKGPAHTTTTMSKAPLVSPSLHQTATNSTLGRYDPVPNRDISPSPSGYYRDNDRSLSRPRQGAVGYHRNESHDNLVSGAASMGYRDRSSSPQPRLPEIDFGHGRGHNAF